MSKDYLTEDTLTPSDQKFVCLSFLTAAGVAGPDAKPSEVSDALQRSTLSGIKVRGVFGTYEAACEYAKKLQSVDPYFNVFVGEVGKWLPFDPAPDSDKVKDSEYANNELNQMMKAYMENQEKAKVYHEQRKTELIRKNILDNLESRHENLDEVQTKLKKVKNPDERASLEKSIESIEDQIKKMEEKKKELDGQLDTLSGKIKAFNPKDFSGPKIVGDEKKEE